MNWWFLIPIVLLVGLFVIPGDVLFMLFTVPIIFVAAFVLEKVLGPRSNDEDS
jgi:hypothetical protein